MTPLSNIIEPTDDKLFNPFHNINEDDLDRVQTDVPKVVKAYLTSLFGRRGPIQQILNTTLYLLYVECNSIGLRGFDPERDHDAIVAAILNQLRGAAQRACNPQDRGELVAECWRAVDELVGPTFTPISTRGGQPTALTPSDSTPLDKGRVEAALDDNQTTGDANSGSDTVSQPRGRSKATGGKTPRRGKDRRQTTSVG